MSSSQDQYQAFQQAASIYDLVKPWAWLGGTAWLVFKAYDWLKTVLTSTKESVSGLQGYVLSLQEQTEEQTTAIVRELKELRSDFRTFFSLQQQTQLNMMAPDTPAWTAPKRRKRTPTVPRKSKAAKSIPAQHKTVEEPKEDECQRREKIIPQSQQLQQIQQLQYPAQHSHL